MQIPQEEGVSCPGVEEKEEVFRFLPKERLAICTEAPIRRRHNSIVNAIAPRRLQAQLPRISFFKILVCFTKKDLGLSFSCQGVIL